ncbi:MAG TPA: glycoside hydrolase family 30 protein [Puia sp.]|nr:glycoside hydrolase family 30 protein [Puia sp.]
MYALSMPNALAQNEHKNHPSVKNSSSSAVSMYVSSFDGDRLTRKPGVSFESNKPSKLPTILIQNSIRFQQIEGFGGTFNEAGMICLNSISPAAREKVLASIFDTLHGAGFNLMKSPIASCDYASAGPWYSYNETPGDTAMNHFSIARDLDSNGLITYIKKAAQFGKFRIETTMDFAPDWMMFGLENGKKHIRPEYYSALARYYSKYIQAYAKHGIRIDWLNPFNESDHNWYSNVSYTEIGELIKNYIVPRFRADQIETKIQLCETASRREAPAKFLPVLSDPEARKCISNLTVHGYDWNCFDTLTVLHNLYPDLPIWQTEVCYALPDLIPPGGPKTLPAYEFSDGEFWGNMIMNDLKHWVCGWIYWNVILDEQGGPWMISEIHGDPDSNYEHPIIIIDRKTKKVTYTGLYFYLSHFSKFIKPGSYRIESSGNANKLNYAAFQNPNGQIVLNVINNGEQESYKIQWGNKMLIQTLKAHSITTLIWDDVSGEIARK